MHMSEQTPTTILVGPNNSGKTSVMDAVKVFLEQGKSLTIHDFSVSQRKAFIIAETEIANSETVFEKIAALQKHLPKMRVEFTFEYEDSPADLNLIQPLLMSLTPVENLVTFRIDFALTDGAKLLQDYEARRHPDKTTLYTVIEGNIQSYFGYEHFKVSQDKRTAYRLKDGGIRHKLIKIDMVPAQRHMDDHEDGKAAKLSKLLHAHYVAYVQPDDKDAFDAIEDLVNDSAEQLTIKYKAVFSQLMTRLRGFGYPQGTAKPDLDIRAEMSSETIYKDNTRIYYAAPDENNTVAGATSDYLPERYNGLGYKNLIYIVLQLETFRAAVDADPEKRPGVHLIGIEEPEAHLHPQMQAVFVNEMGASLKLEDGSYSAQVIMSTHSSHIVSDSNFSPIRYFQKCGRHVKLKDLSQLSTVIPTTPPSPKGDGVEPTAEEIKAARDVEITATLKFLRRYIKLTHCDLLFADKAILVEGRVEKLLIPEMIEKISQQAGYEGFNRQFVTLLEVGGDYAHKIDPLLQFIGIPTLIIADIDSADDDRSPCPVAQGTKSTNAVIGSYLDAGGDLAALKALSFDQKRRGQSQIAYQTEQGGHHGRSFEEAFLYANLEWITANIDVFIADKKRLKEAIKGSLVEAAYEIGRKLNKVQFALDLMSADDWAVPAYIDEGLKWLATAERKS